MKYDDYGNDDYEAGELEGLSIQDNLNDVMQDQDMADAWLASIDGTEDESSPSLMEGMATAESLQLGRISHLEYRIQAGIKEVLLGNDVSGIHPIDAAAAREQFAEEIGSKDLAAFARQIRVDGAVNPPSQERELNQVTSILQNSSGTYMTRGAGGALAGNTIPEFEGKWVEGSPAVDGQRATKGQYKHTLDTSGNKIRNINNQTKWQTENQGRSDEDLVKAVKYVQEIADVYLDDRTRGSSVEDARRQALEESITKRMIDGTFYEGSKNLLPLPNETGVTGIKSTQGIYGSFQGTAEDRLSSSQFDDLYQQIPNATGRTRFVRSDEGHKVFREDVTQEQRNDALRRTPSLANSIFPKPRAVGKQTFTSAEKAKQARDQSFAMSQLQTKANIARKILRQETITTRDESKGNQLRMAGWDTPYGEQADLQNLRNEAAIQGEEWNSFYAGQKDDEFKQSSMNDLVESSLEEADLLDKHKKGSLTDSEILRLAERVEEGETEESLLVAIQDSPKQGTKEWLKQRVGKITASTAAGLLKSGGIEERATELAMERSGTGTSFTGNAHTREGTEGEDKAAAAFLASKHGRGLTMQEAFFEENAAIPNFGVSPDGRLYDDEGNSAGLLELKYLSSGSMEGALTKYTPQLQLQMAVTKESQTHFFALDKYTGEYVHELVQADPTMQAELISAGTQALELGASLDNRGIQALRKEIQSKKRKPRTQVGAKEVIGQQESIVIEDEVDEPMTAFQAAVMAGASSSGGGSASGTRLAKKLKQQEQTDKMKQAVADAKDLPESDIAFDKVELQKIAQKAGLVEVAAAAEDRSREDKTASDTRKMAGYESSAYAMEEKRVSDEVVGVRKMAGYESSAYAMEEKRVSDEVAGVRKMAGYESAAYKEQDDRVSKSLKASTDEEAVTRKLALTEIAAYAEDQKIADDKEKAASEATTKAAKDASSSLRTFGNEVKKAGAVLGELASVVMSGNKSGMDEVRLAASSGIEVDQVRGMRKAMEIGGLSESGINNVISTAGSLVTTFNDERTSASKFTEIMSTRGASNLEEVRNLEMPSSPREFQDMDAQQLTVMVAGMMQGKSREAKTQIGQMFGMTDLAVSNISPEMISGLDSRINEQGLMETNVGIQKVLQEKRALLEATGSLGEDSGKALAVTGIGAAVVGSATAGYLANKFANNTKSAKLIEAAKGSPKGAMSSFASNAGKFLKGAGGKLLGGLGAVYVVGDWAVNEANEIGALFGGELNEENQAKQDACDSMLEGDWSKGTWWADDDSADDAVPSTSIGNMPMQGREEGKGTTNVINVEVTNEISPDLIRTTTNVDGDLNVDEESNIGTGG